MSDSAQTWTYMLITNAERGTWSRLQGGGVQTGLLKIQEEAKTGRIWPGSWSFLCWILGCKKQSSLCRSPIHITMSKETVQDYAWVYSDQPHRSRRKEILAKHPEVKDLFGPDPNSRYWVSASVIAQIFLAYVMREQSWWVIFLMAYTVGGTINHSLFLSFHELAHNLFFDNPIHNTIFGFWANLPMTLAITVYVPSEARKSWNWCDRPSPPFWRPLCVSRILWRPVLLASMPIILSIHDFRLFSPCHRLMQPMPTPFFTFFHPIAVGSFNNVESPSQSLKLTLYRLYLLILRMVA